MTRTATISKDFHFSASHTVLGLRDGHQCGRLHGHNYIYRVELTGRVVEPGFVVDYGELAFINELISDSLDHRDLNSVFDFNPTAENQAAWLVDLIVNRWDAQEQHRNVTRIAVSVSETPKTWATVSRVRV